MAAGCQAVTIRADRSLRAQVLILPIGLIQRNMTNIFEGGDALVLPDGRCGMSRFNWQRGRYAPAVLALRRDV